MRDRRRGGDEAVGVPEARQGGRGPVQRRTLPRTTADLARVQRRARGALETSDVADTAAEGTRSAGDRLPFAETIQASFGRHDVSGVSAHADGAAASASASLGAEAFAYGNHVAFARTPDLHTAAHEAAHVVQQRAGVQLAGGIDEPGDAYERHADEVADLVVAGRSAEAVLDRHAGSGGGASSPVQRVVVLGGKPKDDVAMIAKALGGIASKLELDLDFSGFGVGIRNLIDDKETTDLDEVRNDGSGHHLIRIYNKLSGKDLKPETAPKLVKKVKVEKEKVDNDEGRDGSKDEKRDVEKGGKQPEKGSRKAPVTLSELIKEGFVTDHGEGKYDYAWGGTGRLEKVLREEQDERVEKSADEKTGLRKLVAGKLVFLERASTLPTGASVRIDEDCRRAIEQLTKEFKLDDDPDAVRLVEELFLYGLDTGMQAGPIARQTKRLLTSIATDTPKGEGIAHWVGKIYRRGLIKTLVLGDPKKAPYDVLITQVKGPPQVPSDPKLLKVADVLATVTDILRSPTWLSARTDEEFGGAVGEYIARQEFAQVMPGVELDKFKQQSQLLQLHSVHFVGDLYKNDKLSNEKTDVCSELDLMSVVVEEGTYVCTGLGNVKVTKSSAVPEAIQQNNVAEEALRSHVAGKRAVISAKDKVTADVQRVVGHRLDGKPVELTGKLRIDKVDKVTIGAQKGSGNYDRRISLTYGEVNAVSLLLRERAHKDKD